MEYSLLLHKFQEKYFFFARANTNKSLDTFAETLTK